MALALMFRMPQKCVQYRDLWVLQMVLFLTCKANSIKQYYLNYGYQLLKLNNETKLQNILLQSYTKDIKLKISTIFKYSNSPMVKFSTSLSLLNSLRRELIKTKEIRIFKSLDPFIPWPS